VAHYPASYPQAASGGAGIRPRVPAALSATGVRFPGHPAPAGELSLPHSRPAGWPARRTPTGLSCCTGARHDRAGCSLPGDGGALPASGYLPAGTCRFPAASPCGPLTHPIGEVHFHERSTRVHAIHPSPRIRLAAGPEPETRTDPRPVSSPPAAPGWNRSGSGFYPRLRTPQLPATHARAETGQRAPARVPHLRHQPDLQQRLPPELMHHHAARNRWWTPSPPASPPGSASGPPGPAATAPSWSTSPPPAAGPDGPRAEPARSTPARPCRYPSTATRGMISSLSCVSAST